MRVSKEECVLENQFMTLGHEFATLREILDLSEQTSWEGAQRIDG